MTTEALAPPVTGAPYTVGDLIAVQDAHGVYRAARVLEIKRVEQAIFGLSWMLRCNVRVPESSWGVEKFVYVDDNGSNRTRGKQVRPHDYDGYTPLED